jgi:hypothetical protein
MILPAKALRGTILNTRDRDQWLSGKHRIAAIPKPFKNFMLV